MNQAVKAHMSRVLAGLRKGEDIHGNSLDLARYCAEIEIAARRAQEELRQGTAGTRRKCERMFLLG